MRGLRRFARIEPGRHVEFVVPPQAERLSAIAAMLRAEGRATEAEDLLRAAHERTLAMEQLQTASFVALSRQAFARGDAARGVRLLRLMVSLGVAETRETAAAELAAFDWVRARAVQGEWIEAPDPANAIQEPEALRLAAELAAELDLPLGTVKSRLRLAVAKLRAHWESMS